MSEASTFTLRSLNSGGSNLQVRAAVLPFASHSAEQEAKPETVKVSVSLEDKLVTITTKEGTTMNDGDIKKVIKDAGYDVTTIHHQK